jgi:putative FmdB family regulatory protein
MPIYAYRCGGCGFEKDVMRKVSDPLLTTCPSCQSEQFAKQLTAPGFQLKGTGWYATDFKGGKTSAPATSTAASESSGDSSGQSSAPAAKAESTTSAPACAGGGCACH